MSSLSDAWTNENSTYKQGLIVDSILDKKELEQEEYNQELKEQLNALFVNMFKATRNESKTSTSDAIKIALSTKIQELLTNYKVSFMDIYFSDRDKNKITRNIEFFNPNMSFRIAFVSILNSENINKKIMFEKLIEISNAGKNVDIPEKSNNLMKKIIGRYSGNSDADIETEPLFPPLQDTLVFDATDPERNPDVEPETYTGPTVSEQP